MARWEELEGPPDAEAAELVERAAKTMRLITERRLSESDIVQVSVVTLPRSLGEMTVWYFVHWRTLRTREGDWPSDSDEYVFARGQFKNERVQSWCYPSLAMAAALCKSLWAIELTVPPQN